jgi:hypothetical protein
MAKADVTIVGGGSVTPVLPFPTDDLDTSTLVSNIKPGEPVKRVATGGDFATLIITAEPTYTTTAATFIGIAHNEADSTDTVEGSVDVSVVVPYVTRLRARASTPANINTAAKLQALRMNAVTFDGIAALTGSTVTTPYTIDEDATDDPNNAGLVIVDGDISKGTLDVYVKPLSTLFGNSV